MKMTFSNYFLKRRFGACFRKKVAKKNAKTAENKIMVMVCSA